MTLGVYKIFKDLQTPWSPQNSILEEVLKHFTHSDIILIFAQDVKTKLCTFTMLRSGVAMGVLGGGFPNQRHLPLSPNLTTGVSRIRRCC